MHGAVPYRYCSAGWFVRNPNRRRVEAQLCCSQETMTRFSRRPLEALFLSSIVLLHIAATPAAERKPLGVADIVSMRRITAVAVSGNGTRVGFAAEEPNDSSRSK